MRILLLGANGWLAQFCYYMLQHEFRSREMVPSSSSHIIYGSYHEQIPDWIAEEERVQLDLESTEAVREVISKIKPDIILHFAAISSPFKCHQNPSHAYLVNSPQHVIDAMKEVNPLALYLFASTDMVYDGEQPPYEPTSSPLPVNVYGESKLQYELALLQNLPNGIILRLSNMLGPNYQYHACGEKFLEFLKKSFEQRQLIGLKDDEVRSFVDVNDVCRLILRIIDNFVQGCQKEVGSPWIPLDKSGVMNRVFNVGGPEGLSRLKLARKFCHSRGVDLEIVEKESYDGTDISPHTTSSANENHNWKVYIMKSATAGPNQLISPRNIRMDSSTTEEVWGIKFRKVEDYIGSY